MPTRRNVLAGAVSFAGLATMGWSWAQEAMNLGPRRSFDFGWLVALARESATQPYRPPHIAMAEQLAEIDYDAHWQIRFRDEATIRVPGSEALVQAFYPGRYFPEPVRLHLVDGGEARQVLFDEAYFAIPDNSPARAVGDSADFAGFRVMRPGLGPDWVSFLGASYFRTDGPYRQYGLSARGLAIDTGLSTPEEFPRFSQFWLAAPERPSDTMTVYALLEGPSVCGAYRIDLARDDADGPTTTVSARVFLRHAVTRLGIAPLTSMYWYSERDRILAADWRPEIHDSDGLALATGAGERIWRPLNNPTSVRTSSFVDTNPRGFGLIQRDREFGHYQDDGVFYDRRPSAWIEPIGDWGAGAVQLVEIPAHDETFDNIVAYWSPETLPAPGDELAFDYRIHWADRDPVPPSIATVAATWQGQGGVPGQFVHESADKMVVDFVGPALSGLGTNDGVEAVVTAVRGGRILGDPSTHPIVRGEGWRLVFDFETIGEDPTDLRAYLRKDGLALTETWMAQASSGLGCCRKSR